MPRIVYVNGEWLPIEKAKISVFDRGFLFADSIYEVFAAIDGGLVEAAAHIERLNRSLSEIKLASPVTKEQLDSILRELVSRNRLLDGRVYLQITRGAAERDFLFPENPTPSLVLFTQEAPLAKANDDLQGIKVITAPDIRWQRCDIKSTGILAASMTKQAARDAGADDAWMMRDNLITESSSGNAYIVRRDGTLITHHTGQHILSGVTRHSLLSIARQADIKIEERPFTLPEAEAAVEAFISSSSTFCLPVVCINNKKIGKGLPGPICKRLHTRYIEMATKSAAKWREQGKSAVAREEKKASA